MLHAGSAAELGHRQAVYTVVVYPCDHGTENVNPPFLSDIRVKDKRSNHDSISPKESRQLLTIAFPSPK